MEEKIKPALTDKRGACAYLGGISERKLEYLVANKEISAKRLGRRLMFRYSDLEKFARK